MHTWLASQGVLICASPAAPPTPSQSGPDTVQRSREEGGEEAPPHWTEDANAALKTNKRETQHYYAILNQPTSLFPPLSGPLLIAPPICSFLFVSFTCGLVGVFLLCFTLPCLWHSSPL